MGKIVKTSVDFVILPLVIGSKSHLKPAERVQTMLKFVNFSNENS